MVLDTLTNAALYEPLHPRFGTAFRFLASLDPSAIASGTVTIDGSEVYAIVSRSPGQNPTPSRLEVHRKYIDIQACLEGHLTVGWRTLGFGVHPAGPYSEANDCTLFDDTVDLRLRIRAGEFAVFFPADAHAPEVSPDPLLKVVVKVAL